MTTVEWQKAALVVAVFMALTISVRCYKRRRAIDGELARKAVHMGMGLVAMSFPLLFSTVWPAVVLAAFFTLGLFASRFVRGLGAFFGDLINPPSRQSLGDMVFPGAVGLLFVFSHERALLFYIPMLILTLADSAAALIGSRYGAVRYRFCDKAKTLEGSAAFFVLALLSAYLPLLLFTATGRLDSLLIALTVALLVMLLEAVAWRGLDNLFIPLGAFFLLETLLTLSSAALVVHSGIAACLTLCFVGYCFAYGSPDRVFLERVPSNARSPLCKSN